jgi:hypothetical protein
MAINPMFETGGIDHLATLQRNIKKLVPVSSTFGISVVEFP